MRGAMRGVTEAGGNGPSLPAVHLTDFSAQGQNAPATGRFTFYADFAHSLNVSDYLFSLSAAQIGIQVLSNGALRVALKDSASTDLGNWEISGILFPDRDVKIQVSVDLAINELFVWVNGVEVLNGVLPTNTGQFATNRYFTMLGLNGTNVTYTGKLRKAWLWWDTFTNVGATPDTLPSLALSAPAAVVASANHNGSFPDYTAINGTAIDA